MVDRLCNLSKQQCFFLPGARGTGKSTLLRAQPFFENGFYINLLKPAEQERYSLNPNLLFQQAQLIKDSWIIIDEIQKVPKLLDVVHDIIETYKVKFALTGSSSRKLKRGALIY